MMASFMSYFKGRRDIRQSSRDAIVTLRQQLQLIDKKAEYLQKKIEEEQKKAMANAVTNENAATAALRRKNSTEQELELLQGTRYQLEMQISTLESACFNAETMAAMKKASDALKDIHDTLSIGKVEQTMADIQEQTQFSEMADQSRGTFLDELCQALVNGLKKVDNFLASPLAFPGPLYRVRKRRCPLCQQRVTLPEN